MADKCPYCYRPIGTHTHDPILLPNGAANDWISDTELVYEPDIDNRWYKGFQQITEDEIIELQEELETLEIEYSISPLTTFSSVNNTGKFQILGKHIKEMRDSVEKLLNNSGLTKIDYFNYDEDTNHIIKPEGDKIEWSDPITVDTDLTKFQVKAIHIEDLRHYIRLVWQETWDYDGVHPVKNITESFIATLYPTDIKYFNQVAIYGTHLWDWIADYHYADYASYGLGYTHGQANYSLIQNPTLLEGNLSLSATAQSGITLQPIGFYARTTYVNRFHVNLSTNLTLGKNTKLKVTGVTKTGAYTSGGYWAALHIDCIFRKKTLVTVSPNTYSYLDITLPIILIDYIGQPHNPYGGGDDARNEYRLFGSEIYVYSHTPTVILKHWYGFDNIDTKLVDILNYQYERTESTIDPINIGESCIYNIWFMGMNISTVVFSDTPSSSGPAENSTSISWLVDDIKLM